MSPTTESSSRHGVSQVRLPGWLDKDVLGQAEAGEWTRLLSDTHQTNHNTDTTVLRLLIIYHVLPCFSRPIAVVVFVDCKDSNNVWNCKILIPGYRRRLTLKSKLETRLSFRPTNCQVILNVSVITTSLWDFRTLTSWLCTQHLSWKNPWGTFSRLICFNHRVSDDYSCKAARSEHFLSSCVVSVS